MNLYEVSRINSEVLCVGYDEYESIIVQALNEESARRIHPEYEEKGVYWDVVQECWKVKKDSESIEYNRMDWTDDIDSLTVKLIGKPDFSLDKIVVHSSFIGAG